MLALYDSNNWARREFEVDPTGLPLRRLFTKAFYSDSPGVYIFDGPGAKNLRKSKFPGYKSKRKPASDNFYLMLGFFKELLLHTANVIVEVPGYEADDVIATFSKNNPETEIVIHSTDRDFCALHRPNLTTPIANLKGVAPEDVRLYKTLCGDNSDSISGIVGFGDSAWTKLSENNKKNWLRHLGQTEVFSPFDLGLTKPSHIKFMEENGELLRTFWEIIGFYDVPQDLIAKHTRVGTPDLALANSKLKELLQ